MVVIGGANSAGQAAVYFSGYAARVTMLVRGASLEKSMSHYLIEQIAALAEHRGAHRHQAIAAEGERRASAPRCASGGPDGERDGRDVDACFVFIGAAPRTDWLDGVVARDERGFILAGRDAAEHGWPLQREPYLLETSVPGVFVAGDVRARSIKRVASAVGEGSMAVSLIHEYLVERVTSSPHHRSRSCARSTCSTSLERRRARRVGRRSRAPQRRGRRGRGRAGR